MSDWMGILWLVILLLANAFFVAGEFAVMSARRSQIEPLAETGNKRAINALKAMENVSIMLAICQLGITVCSLLILNVAEPAIHHLFAVPLEAIGIPTAIADTMAFLLALLIVTFLHVTFGEMVPKNMAVSVADKAVLLLATPLIWLSKVTKPIVYSLNWIANHALRLMGIEPKDEVSSSYTIEEVQSIVEESTKHGTLEDDAGILSSALEFSDYTVENIMVKLEDVVTLPAETTPRSFEKAVGRTGFSRFVMLDDDEAYAGYLHLKDVLAIPASLYSEPISVTRLRSLANLKATAEIEDALTVMQRTGSHVARVLNDANETIGILFFEDVLEQLVGEIHDATQQQGYRRKNLSETEGSSSEAATS